MVKRRNVPPAAIVLCALAVLSGVFWLWRREWRRVSLRPSKAVYFHDELVDFSLRAKDPVLSERWRRRPPTVVVRRGGQLVKTIGGLGEVRLSWRDGAWRGRWPCPWNAEQGVYELALVGEKDLSARLKSRPFRIGRRKPLPLPPGMAILTLESIRPFASMEVIAPDGRRTDWRGLLDWAQYVGADAFWMLGGQTPGKNPGEIWVGHNRDMVPQIARECRRRGLKFGIYAMCYLTMSKEPVGGYEYARDVKDGRSVPTRAISLRDQKRRQDVAKLLKSWRYIPGVDYVGLDYIRNAQGGYELVEEFFAEMPGLNPPEGWRRMSAEEKMAWFARKKVARQDPALIDAWQWWRAHKVAQIVRGIKKEVGQDMPLWAFTLTWAKGWHHGQDPVMMNDAGIDADALMLYEADKAQFDAMISVWSRYVKRGDVQLVVGNVLDWPLHQKDPEGPGEFYRRSVRAIDGIYADGPAHGVFIHDASRALWGRLGPWGTRAWMDQARRTVRYLKDKEPAR